MGEIVVVTGANRGIGFEICRQLSEAGCTVILTARNIGKGISATKLISGDIHFLQLDVNDEKSVKSFAAEFAKNFNRLDVLINNAGILGQNTGLPEENAEQLHSVMNTNFYGCWRVSRAVLPFLQKSTAGSIVNISSGMGAWESLTAGYSAYRLSKSSLNALTVLMANELREWNIKVNAVCPGWVRTEMGGKSAPRSIEKGAETPVWLALFPENIATGKFYRDKKPIEW